MVYVDDSRIYFRNFILCRMYADRAEELHAMAAKLNLKRSWYHHGEKLGHYDVSLSKRAEAISLGAILVDNEWVKRRIRAAVQQKLIHRGGHAA